jgi:VWFA-related protein
MNPIVFGVLVVAAATVAPQDAPPQSPLRTGTAAIVTAVVVRDSHGTPVTDLTKADFALYEDGVRQDVADAQLVGAPEGGAGTAAAEASRTNGGRPKASPAQTTVSAPTFVALVFDRLSPEARHLAYRGAQAYLSTQHQDDFAGVFLSDLSLITVQPYTNDRASLARALKDVASRASSTFDLASLRSRDCLDCGDDHPSVPFVAGAESPGRSQFRAEDPVSAAARVIRRGDELWERLERNAQGFSTTNALMSLVSALGLLPGRKTVVFFAEGLALPDAVMPQFRSVVAAANRANVSIYTIDAGGLRVQSQQQETGRGVNAIGALGLETTPDGTPMNSLGSMEWLEDALRKDPHTSLTMLARDTGGFLIDNTNDLAAAVRRIDQDRRFHYLLTYTPKNNDFNGEWRTITVKVPSRPDLQIRARSGYLAVRTPGAIPLLAYEGRAVADLERAPPPAELPVRAAAFAFPQPNGDPRVAIVAETTASAMTFDTSAAGDQFRTDFTLLARLRDAGGEVVRKASQPYRLTGPLADKDKAKAGNVLFYRQPTLPPGSYTLDVAVDDALARKAGVTHVPVTVPAQMTGPRVSDLVLVARGEKAPAMEKGADNVLTVGKVQLYPNLGEPYARTGTLSFYAVILPNGAPLTASLALGHGGTTLATLPLALAAPDANGRIQQLGQLPLASLPPGAYTLTLTVSGGPAPAARSAGFSVVERTVASSRM